MAEGHFQSGKLYDGPYLQRLGHLMIIQGKNPISCPWNTGDDAIVAEFKERFPYRRLADVVFFDQRTFGDDGRYVVHAADDFRKNGIVDHFFLLCVLFFNHVPSSPSENRIYVFNDEWRSFSRGWMCGKTVGVVWSYYRIFFHRDNKENDVTKRENVIAAVQGEKTAYVPSGFWLHFPKDQAYGDAAVKAHVDFFRESETDIMKIMNENVVPHDIPITRASDWKHLKRFTSHAKFIVDEIDLMKRIMDRTENPGVFLLTVHGVVASMWHARGGTDGYEEGRDMLAMHLREDPKAFSYGASVITEALEILTQKALEAGVDGIYYAALGGEKTLFTDEEFAQNIAPCDIAVMKAATGRKGFNVLHMCKDYLALDRYKAYPADVVNWSTFEHNISLEEGRKLFEGKAVLGGFDDRSGLLVDGTEDEIADFARSLVKRMGKTKYILGADCTLPTEIARERIRVAVEAARTC